MKGLSIRKVPLKRWHLSAISFATCMTISERLYAAPTDPWDQAVAVLQTAFTGPIATGLALVAIVVGGLMFAFGEGAAKRTLAGVIFGVGMAVAALSPPPYVFSLARSSSPSLLCPSSNGSFGDG